MGNCGCYLRNAWWRDDAKGVAKNFILRFVFSIYNVIKTVCEYTVLIALILGIVLIFFAAWIEVTSDTQQTKCGEPLIQIDIFIEEVVTGLNYLTQDLPNQAISFTNDTFYKIEDVANSALGTCSGSIQSAFSKGIGGLQDTVNEVCKWGANQSPTHPTPPQISLNSNLNIPSKIIPSGWQPNLSPVDLSELKIPTGGYSVYEVVFPFVEKVYDIPRTVAYYLRVTSAILLAYAGLRILLAFLYSYLPVPDFNWCCGIGCLKVVQVSGEAIGGFFKMLSKPFIHVPLTFGICLILLVTLFLNPNIDKLGTDIHKPLVEADIATAEFIGIINGFIESIPPKVIDWVNSEISLAWTKVRGTLKTTMYAMFLDINTVLVNDVETPINQFLAGLDNTLSIEFPTFNSEDNPINIPAVFIPPIPNIPIQDLTIPTDLLGINKPISPWVNDRIQEMHDIANAILQFGIWLVVIPGIALCFGFGKAFVPRKVNEFFKHPGFYEQDNVDKPIQQVPSTTSTDTIVEMHEKPKKPKVMDRQLP